MEDREMWTKRAEGDKYMYKERCGHKGHKGQKRDVKMTKGDMEIKDNERWRHRRQRENTEGRMRLRH
ncbi:hypothetical protein BgiBS90_001479, partial [Biomphalaria glabrata]